MADPVGILGEIAAAKREELGARFDGVSIDALRARALPTRRSLAEAIAQARRALHPRDQESLAVCRSHPGRRRRQCPRARLCRGRRRAQRSHRRALFRRLARRCRRGPRGVRRTDPRQGFLHRPAPGRRSADRRRRRGAGHAVAARRQRSADHDRAKRDGSEWTRSSRFTTRPRCAVRWRSARR